MIKIINDVAEYREDEDILDPEDKEEMDNKVNIGCVITIKPL